MRGEGSKSQEEGLLVCVLCRRQLFDHAVEHSKNFIQERFGDTKVKARCFLNPFCDLDLRIEFSCGTEANEKKISTRLVGASQTPLGNIRRN